MTFFEFVSKYNGRYVDVDLAYGPQCVDLMRAYCKEVLNLGTHPIPTGDAKDLYYKVSDKDKNFIKIKNLPWNAPKQGDIIFWNTRVGQNGHVAIVNTAGVLKLTSFDQNWGTDKKCRIVEHNYSGVIGWLRKR